MPSEMAPIREICAERAVGTLGTAIPGKFVVISCTQQELNPQPWETSCDLNKCNIPTAPNCHIKIYALYSIYTYFL